MCFLKNSISCLEQPPAKSFKVQVFLCWEMLNNLLTLKGEIAFLWKSELQTTLLVVNLKNMDFVPGNI